jgi:hypothetical protein
MVQCSKKDNQPCDRLGERRGVSHSSINKIYKKTCAGERCTRIDPSNTAVGLQQPDGRCGRCILAAVDGRSACICRQSLAALQRVCVNPSPECELQQALAFCGLSSHGFFFTDTSLPPGSTRIATAQRWFWPLAAATSELNSNGVSTNAAARELLMMSRAADAQLMQRRQR